MEDLSVVADIQQSFFEYRGNFKQPIVGLWFERRLGEIVRDVYTALAPWKVGLENVTWNQAPRNAGEIQLMFGVPAYAAAIQVGLAGVTMTAFNPDWSHAAEFVSMFQTGFEALRASVGEEFQSQQTTWGFHVKPTEKSFRDTMAQFLNIKALHGEDAAMFGVSLYFGDFSFVIDASVIISGGVFIKLIRSFTPDKRFEEMARTLYKDEENVLRLLGLKLQ